MIERTPVRQVGSKRWRMWIVFLGAAALIAFSWGGCFAIGELLVSIGGRLGCGAISEASDGGCPILGGSAIALLLLGAFGGPLFALGIAGCLVGALIAFFFRARI